MESLWRKQTKATEMRQQKNKNEAKQAGEAHYEVIVVGAGMAGLLIAYYLQEAGKQVLVLEADKIASGQTERTTAKITSQHGLKYSNLVKKTGEQKAKLYARANQEAIDEYERLIREKKIDCQFERESAYLYVPEVETIEREGDKAKEGQMKAVAELKEEARVAANLGLPASFTSKIKLPFLVEGALCFTHQAQFAPLKFIQYLAGRLEIWENTPVIGIKGNKVITKDRIMRADKIVMATHYPFLNLPGFYFLRQHQERSYVLALSGCKKIEGMYLGLGKNGLSLRQAGEYLLLGGGSHRTGENRDGGKYDFLKQAAEKYFPEGKVEAYWSAQDCMPHDGIPFIGKYSVFTPHLYVATGFQKWGMTTSMVAAQIIRDSLCGRKNPYAKVFSPQRCNFRAGLTNFLTDMGVSIKGLIKGLLHHPKEEDSFPIGNGGIMDIEGKRYGCFWDEKGELHIIFARCPHMGCALEWNADEKSWDCPCHGSRFDIDGKLLDNPATKNRD
ncbi:MAG: FAD-dependent oxidoreductase [Lachnospiraceae bacterium]